MASKRRNQESQQTLKLLKPEYVKTFCSQTRQEEKEAMGASEDRISCLPESILQSILTMMPLKSAIRTDVLSKKWRNLWKHSLSTATTLEFGKDFTNNLSAEDFVETVNRYLLMNNSKKLERFRVFFCPFDLFSSDIERWLSFATGKRVRYLDIDLSLGFRNSDEGFTDERSPFELPSSLFDCDSLIELSLSRCNFITPLNLINFGGLQSLSISHSNFTDEMLQSILTECSLLESLSLTSCQNLVDIRITVPNLKLKRFTIWDCWAAGLVEINAPKLQSFHFFGTYYPQMKLLNISSLEDASIYSTDVEYELSYDTLLSDLAHVRILTLCIETLMPLSMIEEHHVDLFQIELQNLQELQLLIMTTMTEFDLNTFYNFIYVCSFPHLEKLFIQLPRRIQDPNEEKYGTWNPVLPLDNFTFDQQLKVIKVTNFKGNIVEMRLVSLLLQKATILETLVLVLPFVKEENGKERLVLSVLRGQVLLLQKASPSAQIILHEFEEDDGFNPTHVKIYDDYSC